MSQSSAILTDAGARDGPAPTTGIMGVITPYVAGPGLASYNSGYLPPADFWRLGTIFGLIFLAALLLIGIPLLANG